MRICQRNLFRQHFHDGTDRLDSFDRTEDYGFQFRPGGVLGFRPEPDVTVGADPKAFR